MSMQPAQYLVGKKNKPCCTIRGGSTETQRYIGLGTLSLRDTRIHTQVSVQTDGSAQDHNGSNLITIGLGLIHLSFFDFVCDWII